MHSIVSWFARNNVVANLLMLVIVGGGLMTVPDIRKEVFPEISVDMVTVSVDYRGAAPEEVEEGVCVRIEEAVQDLEGVKRIISAANEGSGSVTVEIETGYDIRELLDDVKARVDAIDTFPEQAEKPVIREVTNRTQVINVSVAGDTDELTLKRLGETIRDDLIELPGITQVDLRNARPYEISIEVSEAALRRYNLTFDQVAAAVRRSSLDLPGGSLRTATGEILLRTKGQAYHGEEFEKIIVVSRPDGTKIRLGDIARVIDGFEEDDKFSFMDGKPAVLVQVYRVGDQSAIDISAAVYDYIERKQPTLPPGIQLTPWADAARILQSRMDLLINNALSGLALVFIVLTLFLRLRLAFWVCLGIPITFLGTLALMPYFDVSINMISLFSFILVLGIVVDDAIVVGESIFERQRKTKQGVEAAIEGTQRVSTPVIFGVLTTVVAFSPMLFVPGYMGKIWMVIPAIVIPTIVFSLIESQLILPAHLSHYRPESGGRKFVLFRLWDGFFNLFSAGLKNFTERIYRPALSFALSWRYLTVAIAVSTLLITAGLVQGGIVKFVFFPQVESDNVVADLTLPQETPVEVTADAIRGIEAAAMELLRELEAEEGEPLFRHVLTTVGEQPFKVQAQRQGGARVAGFARPNEGEVNIELIPSEDRDITAGEIARRWRQRTPPIPDVVELTFTSDLIGSGKAIDIQFAGRDIEALKRVVAETKKQLGEYPGVIDISDSFRGGKPEIKLQLKPEAELLGLSLENLGRQVRQGFFGEEAQRIQRGRDDVRVMVRYPKEQRTSIGDLEGMRVRTPEGAEVAFSDVARVTLDRGFSSIQRVDRKRTINVTAEVEEGVTTANDVLADIQSSYLPELLAQYPGVSYTLEGEQRNQMESMEALGKGFLAAMFAIYALLAVPFRSYLQPFIVMSAVPFGLVGAIWGHVIMGLSVSIMSMCGVVALAGVVVNSSLVLVDFINRFRDEGFDSLHDAVIQAGVVRFRPILLTSLTTAAGLTPLILERSVQAQFLIPMAVALASGVLFATFITLALVPSIYLILEDITNFFRWLIKGPDAREEMDSEKSESDEPRLKAARSRVDPGWRGSETEGVGAD